MAQQYGSNSNDADYGTKIKVIKQNEHKYPVSEMCKILEISRSGYYKYKDKDFSKQKDEHTDFVAKVFHDSHQIYGARKIKKTCEDQGINLSRRIIGYIMEKEGLVSRYTVAQFKLQKQSVNREQVMNIVNQEFNDRKQKEVIVSDLTYVRVGRDWNYVCVIVDLFNVFVTLIVDH